MSTEEKGKHVGTESSNFTLNEFVRLMVLVRDDDRCRHALMKACGSELSKEESDARVTREAFWGMIACRFNDHLVDSKANFTGHLEEIDSNARPVISRSASCLKDHFYSAKKAFTVVYNKWSASGQMDPSNIVAFLTVSSSGDYTMESKRTLITFLVCRVGTLQEETNLIQLRCKLIDNGRGGLDEGVDHDNIAASVDSKAKKRKSTELQRNLDGMSHTLSDFTGYVKKRMDMLDAEKAQSETGGMQYANEGEQEGILIDQILTGIERCKRARELGDEEIHQLAERSLRRSKKQYTEFCNETKEND